jgi:hypothetical protein
LAITLREPALGAVPAFSVSVMETLARRRNGNRAAANEVQELQKALDKSYAQWRERAGREWHRRCADVADPSDACVHVHIEQNEPHALEA